MQVVALALLKKMMPYLVLVAFGAFVGLYLGYHFGSEGLAAAKQALLVQQADDAKAAAIASAVASSELAKANAEADAAETAITVADKKLSSQGEGLIGQITAQVAVPGQDAPDAPILAHTLDALGNDQ